MAIIFTAVTHQVIDHWSDNTWMTWKNTLSCHVPQSAGITHTYYMISFAFTLLLLFFHNLPCHFYITSLFQTSIWRNNGQISREGIQAAVSKLIWQTFLTVSALQSVCPVRGCGAITESAQFTWWDVEHKHVLVIQKCLLALVKTVSVLLSDQTAQGQEVARPDVRHIQHRHPDTLMHLKLCSVTAGVEIHTVKDWRATMRVEGMKKGAQYSWCPCVLLQATS